MLKSKLLVSCILILSISLLFCIFFYKKVYILDDGLMLWYNQPSAIEYNDKVYYSYLGLDKRVKVGKFDNSDIQTKDIFSYPQLDDHGSPTIWIIQHGEERGKILSFFSLHSSQMYFRKSKNPENIQEWEDVKLFDDRRTTYNSIGETSDGKIFVFYTIQTSNGRSYVYKTSTNGGKTWSEVKTLIDFGANEYIYAAPVSIMGKQISIAFTSYRHIKPNIGHKNIYLLQSSDGGENWYQDNNANKIANIPLKKENAIITLKTNPDRENIIWNIKHDNLLNPIILYVDHAPFSNEGWDDTKLYTLKFNNQNKIETYFIDDIESFVYPVGGVFVPNNLSKIISGTKHKNTSELFIYSINNLLWNKIRLNLFYNSDTHKMNPIFPYNSSGKYIIYLDVKEYFKKKYNSKVILLESTTKI